MEQQQRVGDLTGSSTGTFELRSMRDGGRMEKRG
jgi:hypothetical protein